MAVLSELFDRRVDLGGGDHLDAGSPPPPHTPDEKQQLNVLLLAAHEAGDAEGFAALEKLARDPAAFRAAAASFGAAAAREKARAPRTRAYRNALAEGMDLQRKAFEAAFALFEPLVRKAFDPGEARDESGKWTASGGGGAGDRPPPAVGDWTADMPLPPKPPDVELEASRHALELLRKGAARTTTWDQVRRLARRTYARIKEAHGAEIDHVTRAAVKKFGWAVVNDPDFGAVQAALDAGLADAKEAVEGIRDAIGVGDIDAAKDLSNGVLASQTAAVNAAYDALAAVVAKHAGGKPQAKAFAAGVRKAFDPSEPRGADGRWGSGGSVKPGGDLGGSLPDTPHPDAAGHAAHAAEGLAEKLPPGVWDKVGDKVLTAAAKVYGVMLRATPAALTALEWLDGGLTTGDDLKKFGYEPMGVSGPAGSADSLKLHTGISSQVAATIASHVLGRAYTYAKGKLTGQTKAFDDGADEAGELLAEMLSHLSDALGMGWEPDAGVIAAALRGGGDVVEKAHRPAVRKAYDEKDHPRGSDGHWIKKEDIEAAKTDPAKAAELRAKVTDPAERAKLDKHLGRGATGAGKRAAANKPKAQPAGRGGDYLLNVVKRYGGINPKSHEFLKHYETMQRGVQDGLPIQAFNKDTYNGLDTLAEELEADGHISTPPGKDSGEHLLDLLKEKAYSHHADLSDQYEAAHDEYYRRLQEAEDYARESGADRSEIESAVRLGEEAGRTEGGEGTGGVGGEDGGRDEDLLHDGQEGDVDTSFDFGFNTSPGGTTAPDPTSDRVSATHDAIRQHLAGTAPDRHRKILDALKGHTVAELHQIKQRLGLKASGVKADLVNKIALRAQGLTVPTQGYTGRLRSKNGDVQIWQNGKQIGTMPGDNPSAGTVGERMTVDEAHAHVKRHFASGAHDTPEGRAALKETLESRLSVKELRELRSRVGLSGHGGRRKTDVAGRIVSEAKENPADKMDRLLSPLDQANQAGVSLSPPVPADPPRDAHAVEAADAADDKRDRMERWQADKPGSLAAGEAADRARGRAEGQRDAGTTPKPGAGQSAGRNGVTVTPGSHDGHTPKPGGGLSNGLSKPTPAPAPLDNSEPPAPPAADPARPLTPAGIAGRLSEERQQPVKPYRGPKRYHPGIETALAEHAAAPAAGVARRALDAALGNLDAHPDDGPPKGSPAHEYVARRLVSARNEAHDLGGTPDDLAALDRALSAAGVEQLGGNPGETVPFDGTHHVSASPLSTGQGVKVTRPGWKLPSRSRGGYEVLEKVRVEPHAATPPQSPPPPAPAARPSAAPPPPAPARKPKAPPKAAAPTVKTTGDGYHTDFAAGHEEAAAKKYGAAVAAAVDMAAQLGDGYGSLGLVAKTARRAHPEITDADVMAAASWLLKNDVVEGHSMTDAHNLVPSGSGLNGGTDEKTATLWRNGRALHYWMGHRSGDTRKAAADALAKLG